MAVQRRMITHSLYLPMSEPLPEPSQIPLEGVTKIDHVGIHITSLEKSAEFYRKVFGFEVIHRWATTWMLGNEHARIGLFLRPEAQPIADPDRALIIEHVAFLSDSARFDEITAKLDQLGIDHSPVENSGIAYSIFFSDPDGHSIEITYYYATGR